VVKCYHNFCLGAAHVASIVDRTCAGKRPPMRFTS
jgi:hypothetical protein